MIITCPNCKKKFQIDATLVPKEGRDLQCGSCKHVWFYKEENENFSPLTLNENLVNNDVEEIKKLIKFCNLDWEEDCLMFHKNTTPIKTMSTAQARKPIYKSSVKSFDKFKEYFSILNNSL